MRSGLSLTIFLALAVFFFNPASGHAASGPQPITIRVGVAEYQDLAEQLLNYRQFFEELEIAAPSGVQFTLAIGTYGEVLDWYNRQDIDVAVLAAMPMGQLLASATPEERPLIGSTYVATLQETEPIGGNRSRRLSEALDNGEGFRQWDRTHYRPLMVVRNDSPIRTTADLKKYQSKIKFLFVRPFSASGYIVPSYFLENVLDISPDQRSEFTFQHVNSLRRLVDPHEEDGGKYLVAFVYDGVSFCTMPYGER